MWQTFFLKENIKIRWIFSILCSIYVVVFYVFLEPSKNDLITYQYPRYYDIFGILCYFAVLIFMSIILPSIYPAFFNKDTWNLKRFSTWYLGLVILTALVGFLFDLYCSHLTLDKSTLTEYFFDYQIAVDFFIAFPVYLLFLSYNPIFNDTKFIGDAPIFDEVINDSVAVSTQISFTEQFGKNILTIQLEQLYFISSSDNYIDVFYSKEDSGLNRIMIRNTLKAIEEKYQNVPSLFRCHKGYIVNCQKVIKVEGNAKGYFLSLKDVPEKIPVSRNKKEDLEKRLSHLL